jgi:hypothetical protein
MELLADVIAVIVAMGGFWLLVKSAEVTEAYGWNPVAIIRGMRQERRSQVYLMQQEKRQRLMRERGPSQYSREEWLEGLPFACTRCLCLDTRNEYETVQDGCNGIYFTYERLKKSWCKNCGLDRSGRLSDTISVSSQGSIRARRSLERTLKSWQPPDRREEPAMTLSKGLR